MLFGLASKCSVLLLRIKEHESNEEYQAKQRSTESSPKRLPLFIVCLLRHTDQSISTACSAHHKTQKCGSVRTATRKSKNLKVARP